MAPLLLLTLALHACHARCLLYHHAFLSLLCLGSDRPIPALLRKSLLYFISVTALGDVQRAVREQRAWLLYLPTVAAVLLLMGRRELACLAGAAALHCLMAARGPPP